MGWGNLLNADWQPSTARTDLAYALDEETVWADRSDALTAESFTTPPAPRAEPHSVYMDRWSDGWAWRCETCRHHGRGFAEELGAVADANLHGRIVETWA